MNVEITDGASTSMEFLALYTAYMYSNTRWSPLMFYIGWAGAILFCCGCGHGCRICCKKSSKAADGYGKAALEETQTLMKSARSEAEEPKSNPWACCSRKTGRSVGLLGKE